MVSFPVFEWYVCMVSFPDFEWHLRSASHACTEERHPIDHVLDHVIREGLRKMIAHPSQPLNLPATGVEPVRL